MEEKMELVDVYVGPLIDAERAYSALMGHGIQATLLNQNSAIAYGFFPVSVVVRKQDLDSAREVLEESGLRAKS